LLSLLTSLLELEGGGRLLLLLGGLRLLGGEQLGVGGVGWIDEGIHSGTVSTGGH